VTIRGAANHQLGKPVQPLTLGETKNRDLLSSGAGVPKTEELGHWPIMPSPVPDTGAGMKLTVDGNLRAGPSQTLRPPSAPDPYNDGSGVSRAQP
jgi:hypothetical protein